MSALISLDVFGFLEVLFKYLGNILTGLINFLLFSPLMLIFVGVALIAAFAEMVFKKLAGIDSIYVGGVEFGGASSGTGEDLVYAFITDPAVQNVFWAIVGLSIILLFIFTIVALIRSEFALDLKGNAKAPIIARALKSLANFIIVPVVALISVIGVNFLTQTVYDLFDSTTGNSIISKCFYVGAYNANRARMSTAFATQLKTNTDFAGNPIFVNEGENPFSGKEQREVAALIDNYFVNSETTNLEYHHYDFFDNLANCADDGYINFSLLFFGYPNTGNFSYFNMGSINYYYDLTQFDWILAIGSAICMCWILLTTCLVLVKRVFEMTILFLLAPAMTAIAPLDGGNAEKKWRQEFMKRLLAVIGPVFAFNMYFLLVPIFSSITLFSSGSFSGIATSAFAGSAGGSMLGSLIVILASFFVIFDIFFQIICVIVGMSIVKSAGALLSNLLGIEDLVKSGGEAGKKAVATGLKVASLATGVGGVAMKGAAMAIKGGAKLAGRVANSKAGQFVKNKVGAVKDRISEAHDNFTANHEGYAKLRSGVENAAGWVGDKIHDVKEWGSEAGKKVKGWGKKAKDWGKGVAADLGLLPEDVSKELKEKDAQIEGEKDENGKIIKSGAVHEVEAAESRLNKAKKDKEDAMNAGTTGDALAKFDSAIAAAQKDYDDKAEELKKLHLERNEIKNRGKGIFASVFDEEFGENANQTSYMARISQAINKAATEKWENTPILKKIPELTKSWQEQFSIDGDTAKRRLNDGFAGVLGESGGAELFKLWFNKNARAALYEGVPESKKRSAGIEQSLSWGARDKYYEEDANKKAKLEEERLIRRMLAEKRGMSEYEKLIKDRDNATDKTEISKLDAKIEKMEVENGLKVEAADFYKNINSGGRAKLLADYKERMKVDAEDKNYKTEQENNARIAAAAARNGGKVETKFADESVSKAAKEIAKELKDALKEGGGYSGKPAMQMPDLTPLLSGMESLQKLPDIMEKLQAAVDQLNQKKGD